MQYSVKKSKWKEINKMIKNRIIPLLITVSLLGSCFTVSAAEADSEED